MSLQLDNLDLLAKEFLKAWQDAHGVKSGHAYTLAGPDHLAVIIEDSFSPAERKMAEGQTGETLLRQYAGELLSQICDQMSKRIQQDFGRKVNTSNINVNPENGQVMFIFKFKE